MNREQNKTEQRLERWAVLDRQDDDQHVMVYRTREVAEREAANLNRLAAQFPNSEDRHFEIVRLVEALDD